MKLESVKELLVDRYNRRAAKMRPFFLEGIAGIGKTEIVREAASELGLPCEIVCLAAMEAADFSGLPMVDPKTGETRYARPAWLPNSPALIFLDEVNRAAADTLQPLLTLVQDRKINGHVVHPDSMFVFAGNPPGGEYNVQPLDPALHERVTILKVEPDWLQLKVLLGRRYPGSLLEMDWMVTQAKLSPRTIEFTLRAIEGLPKNSSMYLTMLTAEIGAEGAGALIAYLKKQQKLCADQLEITKQGRLTEKTKKFIKQTWESGNEAIPTFTALAKEMIAKINASTTEKEFSTLLLQMLDISHATGDAACASIYLDLYMEIEKRKEWVLEIFKAHKNNDPSLEYYKQVVAAEVAAVEYQK